MKVGCFVTSHGMGHATRACAVMQALNALAPGIMFEIFTNAPAWIFEHSLEAQMSGRFRLHEMHTDIGLIQRTPFEEDLPETLRQLAQNLPYSEELISQAAQILQKTDCKLAFCDIAPLGILAAKRAGIPSVLIENFRWDWIYAAYTATFPQFQQYIDYLGEIFCSATVHIQTEPLCDPVPWAARVTPPISRLVRTPAPIVRAQIGVPQDRKLILVTSSATPDPAAFAAWKEAAPELFFAFPDHVPDLEPTPNGVRLPRRFYHPDLVNASAAVVGKAGYSTLAEVYHAGALFAYISRARFRESAILGEFIQTKMGGFEISPDWQDLAWLPELRARLASYSPTRQGENGAWEAARLILQLLPAG